MTTALHETIDWSGLDESSHECGCICGAVFLSAAKCVFAEGKLVSKKPCPACGRHDALSRITAASVDSVA